jgi:transmembrane sensor
MNRRMDLLRAAQWASHDGDAGGGARAAGQDIKATLDDPALCEALNQAASFGRLSDEDVRALRAARRRRLATGSAAAIVAIIGVGMWHATGIGVASPVVAHYETRRGELLTVALADGSKLQLNGATSLDVTLGEHERSVMMRRGEVYFDVAHETARPFVIDAGGARTRVLGTGFDIDLAGRAVKLAVYRGAVRFGPRNRAGGPSGAGADGVTVLAGWRSRFSDGIAGAPARFDVTQQDWRENWLDTDDMRLGDLVEALNRRGGPLIQAPPPQLAKLTLSGRFKLDNPGQLLGVIGSAYGFGVTHTGTQMRLVSNPAAVAKASSL